jgi:hypothetical protein
LLPLQSFLVGGVAEVKTKFGTETPVDVSDLGVLVGYEAADFTLAAQTYVPRASLSLSATVCVLRCGPLAALSPRVGVLQAEELQHGCAVAGAQGELHHHCWCAGHAARVWLEDALRKSAHAWFCAWTHDREG